MDISVVSGTFNRISYLQRMVESARRSIGTWNGLTHELVIVDGGSQDGTLDWCRQQPDVRLIEHGKLLGAVKAFNDGARASEGDYVILANDDIEFLPDSIWRAWLFMQEHPDCGQGCFYQDRGGHGWHVECMPVVMNGVQATADYGQVCIMPKVIGERAGWWGDYLHTYGGDNELASQIYEMGFKVLKIKDAKIHDSEPKDELRKINNIDGGHDPRAVRGHHPDSYAWGQKWRRFVDGRWLVGPEVKDTPGFANPTQKRERVLYLPIYEAGWPIQKEQKRGLREALAKVAVVAEYDYVGKHAERGKDGMLEELRALCLKLQPTLVLTQLHNGGMVNGNDVASLRDAALGALFVNWNGDFWPENLLSEDGVALARAFDLQLTVNRDVLDRYYQLGVNADYWQIGWEPDGVGHEPGDADRCDVVFLANGYSQERRAFVKKLRGLRNSFRLWGNGWPDGWACGQCTYDFVTACKAYRGAKISLGDSQWPDSGFVSNRVFQALAAGGSALAHQWFRDMERLGLVDGETCIVWRDFSELEGKLRHYLAHEDERRRITEAGQRLALERHSFDARVRELFELLEMHEYAQEECWR